MESISHQPYNNLGGNSELYVLRHSHILNNPRIIDGEIVENLIILEDWAKIECLPYSIEYSERESDGQPGTVQDVSIQFVVAQETKDVKKKLRLLKSERLAVLLSDQSTGLYRLIGGQHEFVKNERSFRTGGKPSDLNANTIQLRGKVLQVPFFTGSSVLAIVTAPSNLSAVASSASQIDLSWDDNSDNETGFEVQRSTNGVTWVPLVTKAINVTSHSDSGLAYNTSYYYRVRATGTFNSEWSNIVNLTTPYTPYDFQNGLIFDGINDRWTNPGAGRPTYEVYYAATFIYWFRVTENFSGTAGLFYSGLGTGSNQINGSISGDGAGNGSILIRNGYTGQPAFDYAATIPLEVGKRHMVAITFSGYDNDGEARVYFDGVKVAEDLAVPSAIKNVNTSHFSSNGGTSTYHVPGVAGEMRIIGALTSGSNATPSSGESAILSDAEIAQIYNQGFGNDGPYDKFDAADFRWLMRFNSNAHGSPETNLSIANEGGTPVAGVLSCTNFASPIYDNYFEPF